MCGIMTIYDCDLTKLCECGCGKKVNIGNRFIHGHNQRNVPSTTKGKPRPKKIIKKISEQTKKRYDKMDDPGLEIVTHHYIYDHSDLSLNTIQMTRRDHGKLHGILRGLNYKVPHINGD